MWVRISSRHRSVCVCGLCLQGYPPCRDVVCISTPPLPPDKMLVLTSFCPSPPTDVSSRACVGSDTTVVMVTLLMTSSKASKHNLAKHLQAGDQLFILFVIMFTLFCEQAIGCLMCLWSCLLCFTKLSVRCRIKGDEKGIIFTASTRQAALYSWCYQSYVPCGAVCSVHTLVFTCLAVFVVVVVVPCIVFCPHSFLVGTCCERGWCHVSIISVTCLLLSAARVETVSAITTPVTRPGGPESCLFIHHCLQPDTNVDKDGGRVAMCAFHLCPLGRTPAGDLKG